MDVSPRLRPLEPGAGVRSNEHTSLARLVGVLHDGKNAMSTR
jgi:hypothetical protein